MTEDRPNSIPDDGALLEIDSLWKYADPIASEASFRSILPAAMRSGNDDYHAQLLTQIARAEILQRQFDAGHATLDEARALLSDRTPTARIRHLLERGRAWNDTNQAREAKGAFEEAFALASSAGLDALAVDAAHMLGVMPPYDTATGWNQRAVAIAQASADPRARRWLGSLHLNLGVGYQRLEQHAKAQDAFTAASSVFTETGNHARIRLARTCLTKTQRLMGDAAGALPLNEQLLAEIRDAREPEGYVLEEIAECMLALHRPDDATPYFAGAYAALSTYPWFAPNESERLHRLGVLGKISNL